MIHLGFLAIYSGLDLNFDSMIYGLLRLYAKDPHEPLQACFLSTHGVFAIEHFSSMHGLGHYWRNHLFSLGELTWDKKMHLIKVVFWFIFQLSIEDEDEI